MTTFGTIVPDAEEPDEEPTVFFVESADPVDLANKVNALLFSLVLAEQVITNMTLAGAGDGHTFCVLIEVVEPGATDGGIAAGSQDGFASTIVRCYLGGSEEELARARLASGVPAPIPAPPFAPAPYSLVDEQFVGGAKGQRFMGMAVYTVATIPPGLGIFPHVLGIGVTQALGAGQTILTFDSLDQATKFGFVTQQEIEYQGDISAFLFLEASVSVTQATASDFTVAIVSDPLGTADVIASMQSHAEAGETDTVAVYGFAPGVPSPPLLAGTKFGLLVTGVAGTSEGSQLRIWAR